MAHRSRKATVALCVVGLVLTGSQCSSERPAQEDNVVLRWNEAALEAVRASTLGPPMVSRALAILHTCMYDAWAAYDQKAVGTRMGGRLRQAPSEYEPANQNKAMSFAAYRAAIDVFPASKTTVFDPLMKRLGYDANDRSTATTTPSGVGNVACQAVLEFRHRDGSNQLGDEPGGTPGVPYSDYTAYKPANPAMALSADVVRAGRAGLRQPGRWQPLTYSSADGTVATPKFLAPFWSRVVPFALPSGAVYRSPTGPAPYGSSQFTNEVLEVLEMSARLDDERKVIAEYWSDGPRSETPPGHWNLLGQYVSRRDRHDVAADVKMFFALNNAMFDAGIVAWDNKVAFDSVRPITAIRNRFRGVRVRAWAGPYQGTKLIDGGDWLPYQASTFPTPPFAEYPSGHSNFSAAAARVLALFTGDDDFGMSVVVPAGTSKVEPGAVPAKDVTLSWDTFAGAANQAGLSRRYGGIHFRQADLDARQTGRRCGDDAWAKALTLFRGASTTAP